MHQPMQGAQAQVKKAEKHKGWGCPQLAKKAHYFIDGMSLCRKWMFLGQLEDARHDHPENCATCNKARIKTQSP